ncbi:MAG TPA: DUF2281 domain-containing protein [Verrucomicrobiae bacterium]|nr:DUF2281 domain-containing protein [Verrucomicrobiae bacterium]
MARQAGRDVFIVLPLRFAASSDFDWTHAKVDAVHPLKNRDATPRRSQTRWATEFRRTVKDCGFQMQWNGIVRRAKSKQGDYERPCKLERLAENHQANISRLLHFDFGIITIAMSVAEQIFEKAQGLLESAQKTVLQLVDKLIEQNTVSKKSAPKAGSAEGRIHMAPDFEKPLEDFKPYME